MIKDYKLLPIALFLFLFLTVNLTFAANGCGSEKMPDFVPDAPLSEWIFGNDELFTPACNTHDECYANPDNLQSNCDEQFHEDLIAICDDNFSSSLGLLECKASAKLFYAMVSEFGAGSHTGSPDGLIIDVQANRIGNNWSDDELEVCVTFANTGTTTGEYDVVLYADDGTEIDTEPDTYYEDVKSGYTKTICVGTEGIWASISDMGDEFGINLREEDFGVVDSYIGDVP